MNNIGNHTTNFTIHKTGAVSIDNIRHGASTMVARCLTEVARTQKLEQDDLRAELLEKQQKHSKRLSQLSDSINGENTFREEVEDNSIHLPEEKKVTVVEDNSIHLPACGDFVRKAKFQNIGENIRESWIDGYKKWRRKKKQ